MDAAEELRVDAVKEVIHTSLRQVAIAHVHDAGVGDAGTGVHDKGLGDTGIHDTGLHEYHTRFGSTLPAGIRLECYSKISPLALELRRKLGQLRCLTQGRVMAYRAMCTRSREFCLLHGKLVLVRDCLIYTICVWIDVYIGLIDVLRGS